MATPDDVQHFVMRLTRTLVGELHGGKTPVECYVGLYFPALFLLTALRTCTREDCMGGYNMLRYAVYTLTHRNGMY